jgi:hypothetical protein
MDKYCVLWIDTDARFHIKTYSAGQLQEARTLRNAISESGLPVQMISRKGFIRKTGLR